jgi:hypothetical protein
LIVPISLFHLETARSSQNAFASISQCNATLNPNLPTHPTHPNSAATLFTWAWIYDLFVYSFGTYGLFLSVKYISWFYVFDSCTVIVVQSFFAWRGECADCSVETEGEGGVGG